MKWLKFSGKHVLLYVASYILFGFVSTKSYFDRQAWFYPQKISKTSLENCDKGLEAYVIIQNKLMKKDDWYDRSRPRFVLEGFVFDKNKDTVICRLEFKRNNAYRPKKIIDTIGTSIYLIDLKKLLSLFNKKSDANFLYFTPKDTLIDKTYYIKYYVTPVKEEKGNISADDIKNWDKLPQEELNPSPPRGATK